METRRSSYNDACKRKLGFQQQVEMSQYQPAAGGELPEAFQYRLQRNLRAVGGGGRSDAPSAPLGRYCVFVAAGMLATALVTILVTLYVATVWTMHIDEDETYGPGDSYDGGGSSEPVLPVYYEKSTPGPRMVHLPTSLRKVLNPNDPRYTDPHHQTVCVFHADAVGLTVRSKSLGASVAFKLSYFPFALCRVVLFCCPSLAANLEPGPEHPEQLMRRFVVSAQGNRFLSAFVMLGNGSSASEPQFNKLLDDLEAQSLDNVVGTWYKERGYAGVVLRWPETASDESWKRMPKLLAWLKQTLSQSVGLKLGVALRQDAVGPDFTQLASSLGPVSLFLLPPDMPASKYQGQTIRYFSEATLMHLRQLYTNYFASGDTNDTALANSVCYLLPADAYTFKVTPRNDSAPRPSEQSLGPGVEGNVTRVAGRMAYFESCRLGPESRTLEMHYGTVATLLDNWVSFTKPPQLATFLDSLHDNMSATCMGLWNPQWDDFGELCGTQAYPLAMVAFRLYNDTH
ncbi:probable chitinase 10 isoform X1 [Rhipicephalus sanguineus]|uniref:probable chitinase 10 isoform X1 n=1 Tax=Rhipicephalus sanguineus TaxID=34632 RepID=UPI00189443D0|nr:probable chitinase 10 isoform X1 [Rhipicephalus sanguineus]